ncbi:MAG: hypothetical protein ABSF67_19510 [Roseiarcus sp.]|jgi:hypothetical protein
MTGETAHGLGPFDPYWTDEIKPPRRGSGWPRRLVFGLGAALAIVGVAALAPLRPPGESAGTSVVAASPPSEVIDLSAVPALAFDGVAADQIRHETRLDRAGPGRSDTLSVGRVEGSGPALRVETWRYGARRTALSLFVAAAETAAAGGAAVERLGATQTLASASGPIEWAGLTLAGGGDRGCAAFRLAPRVGGLRGVVCAAAGATVDEAALACVIERLSLTKAGREAGFADVLKPGPARGANCRTPFD